MADTTETIDFAFQDDSDNLSFLDGLSGFGEDVVSATRAALGTIVASKLDAETRRAVTPDQSPVQYTSPVQVVRPFTISPAIILLGVALIAGVYLAARKG